MFAPGLPSKKLKSSFPSLKDKRLPFVIQKHNADRAGLHYDFRISDGSIAYSWATRKGLPSTGVKHLFVRQPDHTPEYMSFQGQISDGYGKGKVSTFKSGNVHILESSTSKIKFNIYNGQGVDQYILINTGSDNWLCINITPTLNNRSLIPTKKVKYKEGNVNNLEFNNSMVLSPKIDGSASLFVLKKERPIEVFSYRKSKRGPELINRTYKYPYLYNRKVPKELDNTTLWGESFVVDSSNKPLPYRKVSGLLNMNTDKAVKLVNKRNYKFDNIIYNINTFKGKKFIDENYGNKLKKLREINTLIPELKLPELAVTEKEKRLLFESIKRNKNITTGEGLVGYNIYSSKPIKFKFKKDTELYINGFEEGRGRLKGTLGKIYGVEDSQGSGPIIAVGSGFTDKERRDIWADKKSYMGLPAKIQYQERLPSGKLRTPIYKGIRRNWI